MGQIVYQVGYGDKYRTSSYGRYWGVVNLPSITEIRVPSVVYRCCASRLMLLYLFPSFAY